MKLKCVGGPCDGEWSNVRDDFREGDQVQVLTKLNFTVATFQEDCNAYIEGRMPKSLSVPYHYYIVNCFHWINEQGIKLKLFYLIPHNFDTFDAIKHLLAAHQPCS